MSTTTDSISDEQRKLAEELLFSEKLPLSFAKSMFFGKFDESKALPYSKMSDTESDRFDIFMSKFREFLDQHLDPDWIDRHAEIPEELIKGLGEIGLLGMTVPEEYGGQGFSQHAYCKAMEELGSRCGATTVFVNVHHSVGLRALLMYGSEGQKRAWLPQMCAGEKIAAFALTEANAGSDVSNIETVAEYLSDEDCYVLNGTKQWITNGGIADVLTVMAKTEVDTDEGKKMKITAFLVESDMPGFVVAEKAMEKVGVRGTLTAKLEFCDLKVPAANIIGEKGAGLAIPLGILNFGRITFGAGCTGAAKYCMDRVITHSKERIQFGRPLAEFGMIKAKVARISALTYAMDAGTYLTASMFDRGIKDYMLEAAMIKVFASESLWEIVNETIQVFGGKAFFCDQPFERMMRDARLNSIAEGANEVLRNFIGLVGMREVGMEMHDIEKKSHHLDSIVSCLSEGMRSIWSLTQEPTIPLKVKELSFDVDELRDRYRIFHWHVARCLAKHKEEVVEKQLIVNRFANMAIDLYLGTAVVERYDSDYSSGKLDKITLNRDLERARCFLKIAFQDFDARLYELKHNIDEDLCGLADSITGV